ncbi:MULTISPECIES: LysR family transcriptional regulator [unclassified Actinomyces]|uniref:LysR family transcriptional regulator n=1 Tax=unclassified Actinomyces TaxID=2609248 RepID=UPI000D59AA6B|nr:MULTISPECIES: LysR family transcriptional regulator [unclassified Actinomyces]RAX19720.1 LysR family transcriptional regulator [Actinomyces sp. Z5]RAX24302.1 LysR family transcriptional regulator [Actinomyces sp. Z3]
MPLEDLNLARTFVTLYETRSATAAADRLNVTQPTVSYALGRLRRRFADDLFRRRGRSFVPTPRASSLYHSLKDAVVQIDRAVDEQAEFDPAATRDEFTLALSSIGEQVFLPRILQRFRQEAPGARLRVIPAKSLEVEDTLVRGAVDLSISVSVLPTQYLWRTPFLPVTYVAVTSRRHPLQHTGTTMFNGRRFVRVAAHGGHIYPNQALERHCLLDSVAMWVESYATVPLVVESSDLVALLPRHVGEVYAERHELLLHDLPWPIDSPPVSVYTRTRERLSPPEHWLRRLVLESLGTRADEADIPPHH